MEVNKNRIDFSDIPEITDFSKMRPSPFIDKIRKKGFSLTVHYSPEDVERLIARNGRLDNFDLFEHDEDELAAFEEYRRSQELKS